MEKTGFEENCRIIKETLACENNMPATAFFGKAAAFHNSGLTLGQAFREPLYAAKKSVDYIYDMSQRAGAINCFVSLQATDIAIPLSKVWFSKVLRPGKDFADDVIWQIKEECLFEKDDYKKVAEKGFDFFFEKYFFNVVDREEYSAYCKTEPLFVKEAYGYAQKNGFPVLANCSELLTTPFEMLGGARGMKNFFMDIYEDIGLVKAALDAMYPGYANIVKQMLVRSGDDPDAFGSLIGGWRSASDMVGGKIFEQLVWPHLKGLGEVFVAAGKVPVYHLDSCWDREIGRFECFKNGSIIIQTDGATDMVRASSLLGNGYAFIGDVPPAMLLNGSEAEIVNYVNKLLGDFGPRGLFICPGCEAPYPATDANISAIYKTVAKWS